MKRKKLNECEYCGNPTKNPKFCNNTCQQALRRKKIFEEMESTGIAGHSDEHARGRVKSYLEQREGKKCSICGIDSWLGQPIPLVCDHIDGDCSNNNLDNFRLICNNCDSLLPTFKGRNKKKNSGMSRHDRKRNRCECGKIIDRKAVKCRGCHLEEMGEKSKKPDKTTLIETVADNTWKDSGKILGVSDNTVRKWVISYGLPTDRKKLKGLLESS